MLPGKDGSMNEIDIGNRREPPFGVRATKIRGREGWEVVDRSGRVVHSGSVSTATGEANAALVKAHAAALKRLAK